ncbi:uncharacterized protein NESG_00866 [Nematocida ausubeli]|uniref:Uncharacterized protein n=1 Tax=Nematocida ausubeli (strain ATCC PRA-371 / ERTm2) TaxID=1913371 RepID=A0A086J3J4_NEMA1|nr:uncharacterized protein NESG_00866 [Nematocida ausubeli]KFG26712.1 hypothetical protein NESG_00866 [Nematocida ausubeli]
MNEKRIMFYVKPVYCRAEAGHINFIFSYPSIENGNELTAGREYNGHHTGI